MKHIIALSLIAISATFTTWASPPIGNQKASEVRATYSFENDSTQDLKVINICDLTDRELNQAIEGHLPNVAVEFSKHTVLPISFYLKGDLLALMDDQENLGKVKVMQTFYVRCVDGELILSCDLSEWKPFLEFITGNVSVVISIQDGQPCIMFGSETNRRM